MNTNEIFTFTYLNTVGELVTTYWRTAGAITGMKLPADMAKPPYFKISIPGTSCSAAVGRDPSGFSQAPEGGTEAPCTFSPQMPGDFLPQ
jgi:hypothetical protein